MAFDYKKEYKEFYLPPQKPAVVRVPPMNYVAVRGQGNPNDENGEYKRAIGILYAVSYTLKMSKLGKHKLEGYFDYVVPPLEGLWRMNDGKPFDYALPQNSTFRPVFEAVYVLNFQRIFVVWIDMDFMLRNHLSAHFFTFFFGNNARGDNVSDFNMDDFSATRTLDVQIITFFALAQFVCAYGAASKSFHNSSVCSC